MATTAPTRTETTPTDVAWRRVAVTSTALAVLGHLVVGAVLSDLDAVFIAIALTIALGLTRLRRGTAGWALLLLILANVAFWTVTATASNLAGTAGTGGTVLAASAATLSAVGVVACAAVLAGRGSRRGARRTVIGALAVLALLVAAAVVATGGGTDDTPADAAVEVRMDRTAFDPDRITVSGGTTTFVVENHDYFWHTFTVRELDLDLRIPVGAHKSVTVDVPPGTYEVICAIPGHDQAGMTATLVADGVGG